MSDVITNLGPPADTAAVFSSTPSFQKLRLEINRVTPEIHGSETKEQK